MTEEDLTTLNRVYKETVQRVACTPSSLVSLASFILVSPPRNLVLVWHGRGSSAEDVEVANEIAKEYKAEEKRARAEKSPADVSAAASAERNEVLSITEGAANASDILAVLFDVMWLTPEEYKYRNPVSPLAKNSQKTFHVIERSDSRSSKFRLRKLGAAVPDKHGCVALLPFPVYNAKKIALLVVGDQYDLWFGESVSRDAQAIARQLVLNLINSAPPLGDGVTKRDKGLFPGVVYDAPLRIQVQGFEDPAFRCHFQPEVEFARRRERNHNVYIRERNANEMLCAEASCVDVFSWIGSSWAAVGGTGQAEAAPQRQGLGADGHPPNDVDGAMFRTVETPKKFQHPYGEMERTSSINAPHHTPY